MLSKSEAAFLIKKFKYYKGKNYNEYQKKLLDSIDNIEFDNEYRIVRNILYGMKPRIVIEEEQISKSKYYRYRTLLIEILRMAFDKQDFEDIFGLAKGE